MTYLSLLILRAIGFPVIIKTNLELLSIDSFDNYSTTECWVIKNSGLNKLSMFDILNYES